MEGSAPKETGKIVHIPEDEARWRQGVVQHARNIAPGSGYTVEQATPSASQPIPDSSALKEVGAERIGAEPPINLSDIRHGVSTLGTTVGGVSPDTYDRTISGHNAISLIKERARRFFRRRKAA